MSFRDSISTQKQRRLESGLLRELHTVDSPQGVVVKRGGRQLVNFCSNDYLGLSNSDNLKRAAQESIKNWGVGAGASHLICGHQTPHHQLELELAEFVGAQKAIVFSTGYMANLAIPSAFLTRHDLLLQDKLNHATDGVFSMDGTVADVNSLHKLCDCDNRLLLVDDAHGFGVLGNHGRGTLEQAGIQRWRRAVHRSLDPTRPALHLHHRAATQHRPSQSRRSSDVGKGSLASRKAF